MTTVSPGNKTLFHWLLVLFIIALAGIAYCIHNKVDKWITYVHIGLVCVAAVAVALLAIGLQIILNIKESARMTIGIVVGIITWIIGYFFMAEKVFDYIEDISGQLFDSSVLLICILAIIVRTRMK